MSVDLAERGESPAASECPHVDVLLLWRRREVGVGSLEKLFNCERTRGKKHEENRKKTSAKIKALRHMNYYIIFTGDSAVVY